VSLGVAVHRRRCRRRLRLDTTSWRRPGLDRSRTRISSVSSPAV
jgi:hypothetical protein